MQTAGCPCPMSSSYALALIAAQSFCCRRSMHLPYGGHALCQPARLQCSVCPVTSMYLLCTASTHTSPIVNRLDTTHAHVRRRRWYPHSQRGRRRQQAPQGSIQLWLQKSVWSRHTHRVRAQRRAVPPQYVAVLSAASSSPTLHGRAILPCWLPQWLTYSTQQPHAALTPTPRAPCMQRREAPWRHRPAHHHQGARTCGRAP